MKFVVEGADWTVRVLTGWNEDWMHFTLTARGQSEDACKRGIDVVVRLLGGGRTLLWRIKPEYQKDMDFERGIEIFSGFARFTAKVVGGEEHEPAPQPEEIQFLGIGSLLDPTP